MIRTACSKDPQRIHRVDKFRVPSSARSEFVEKVRHTHEFLRTLPGFIQDFVLVQTGGPGAFNFVTIAVWESVEAIHAAKMAVMAEHEAMGFNPGEMFTKLGIEADLANYTQIDA